MNPSRPESYGEQIADRYDTWYPAADAAVVARLAELARGGRALELGIGTGRLALPLKEAGIAVSGIDASPAMVKRLRAKPGGDTIPVTIGDFADVAVEGPFDLVFVVFNTFFALTSQEEQLRCFARVADALAPDGVFLLEVFVPDLARFEARQVSRVSHIGDDEVRMDLSRLDLAHQRIETRHLVITNEGMRLLPVSLRYVWPAELDLMARLAGLELRERWDDWSGSPFTAGSGKHVSVYGRPGGSADAR